MKSLPPLIVVDVQNGFVKESSEHVVQPIAEFAERWAAAGGTVIATRFINPPGSQWERLIHWSRLRSSPDIDLAPPIAQLAETQPVHVVDKTSYTSLTPEVLDLLGDASTVYICGIATDGCVLRTAVDVFERGLTPLVLKDLCASHAGEATHQEGLHLTGRFIGIDQLVDSAGARP